VIFDQRVPRPIDRRASLFVSKISSRLVAQINPCFFKGWFLYLEHLAPIEQREYAFFIYCVGLATCQVAELAAADGPYRLTINTSE